MASEADGATPTLLFQISRELVILVHGPQAPSSRDWDAYLDALGALSAAGGPATGVLVVTDGTNPSAAQRQAMNRRFPVRIRVAVVTAEVVARGVVTLFSWFNPLIRAFTPDEFSDALAYLGVDSSRYVEVRGNVADMRLALFTRPPVAGRPATGSSTP